jgi:hypothetical protein
VRTCMHGNPSQALSCFSKNSHRYKRIVHSEDMLIFHDCHCDFNSPRKMKLSLPTPVFLPRNKEQSERQLLWPKDCSPHAKRFPICYLRFIIIRICWLKVGSTTFMYLCSKLSTFAKKGGIHARASWLADDSPRLFFSGEVSINNE